MDNKISTQASDEPMSVYFYRRTPDDNWKETTADHIGHLKSFTDNSYEYRTLYVAPVIPAAGAADDLTRKFAEAIAGKMSGYIDRETDESCCAGCGMAEVFHLFEANEPRHTDGCIVVRAQEYLEAISAQQGPEGK